MEINIDNYEEFFLLYADNELSETERKKVENFVESNPCFSDEFILLNQTILKPNSEVHFDKTSLFKSEESDPVFEKKLLSYLDNELDDHEKLDIENRRLRNDVLNDKIMLLERTISKADLSIVFPEKSILYKNRKIVPLIWIRSVAAAAILVGFGLFLFNNYSFRDNVANKQVAAPKTTFVSKDVLRKPISTNNISSNNIKENVVSNNPANIKVVDDAAQDNTISQKAPVNYERVVAKIEDHKMTNDLPIPDPSYTRKITDEHPTIQPEHSANINSISTENSSLPNSGFTVQPVSYVVKDENNDDENKSITSIQFQKSKLGSFLKKASRTIARKLKVDRDDDQNN